MSKTYVPTGTCIYCGATEYRPGSGEALHDEHIVPEGLGGTWILPESSCEECERRINPYEQKVIRHTFQIVRHHAGVKSKKRTPHGFAELPFVRDGRPDTLLVPVEDYPGLIVVLTYFEPRALFGLPADAEPISGGIACAFDGVGGKLLYDLMQQGSVSVPPHRGGASALEQARFLAKVAHAYAVAERGLGAFEPALLPIIRGTDTSLCSHYVGGTYDEVPEPHMDRFVLSLREQSDPAGRRLLVCDIRLFAHLRGMPRFLVVVGILPASFAQRQIAAAPPRRWGPPAMLS